MEAPVSVILAAGKSTRMKSALPKVLHHVCGRPLVDYVLDAARVAGVQRQVVIVGHQAEQVKQTLSAQPDVEFALQSEQKGTGHAVMMSRENLQGHRGPVLILTGDAPLMRPESFTALLEDARREGAACVIGTARTDNNFGLGRIVRDAQGEFLRIVEEKDATPEERQITEINVGCYVFDGPALFQALDQIRPNNKQGEYYLTDCAAILLQQGQRVIASCRMEISEALGVNTREQLAEIERFLQRTHMQQLMANGVTIVNPDQTAIDPRAQIGADTIIHPFTVIAGPSRIGANCQIGPQAYVGPNSEVADGTVLGPFERV